VVVVVTLVTGPTVKPSEVEVEDEVASVVNVETWLVPRVVVVLDVVVDPQFASRRRNSATSGVSWVGPYRFRSSLQLS
jgi:hypothetical protein